MIDGAKALRRAVSDVLGTSTPVQRCVRHKERNVLDHLAERDRAQIKRRLRAAWALENVDAAVERLEALGSELERSHPGAAASLREGLAETVTVNRLGVGGALKATLSSTNPCESMIEFVRRSSRNVKRWQSGEMCLRWTAAGMLESRAAVSQGDRLPRARKARQRSRARGGRYTPHDRLCDAGARGCSYTRMR